jgi:hypothetical protein
LETSQAPVAPINPSGAVTNTRASREKLCNWTISSASIAIAFHGAWLDAFVYAEAAFTVFDPELLRLLPARILVDEQGFAKTLIERVDALNQRGPLLLPEGEDEMVRVTGCIRLTPDGSRSVGPEQCRTDPRSKPPHGFIQRQSA